MSKDNYRILEEREISKYEDCPWFPMEAVHLHNVWLVPEKYLIRELEKKSFCLDKLQELINEFDFEEVYKCMKALDWTWCNVTGTPTIQDMIRVVKELYELIEDKVLEGKYACASTGGFTITFIPEQDNELNLKFIAEEYSV